MKKSLLIISNLYPLPWEPNRATFNKQQFSLLDDEFDKSILIPVAFPQWLKHKKDINQSENIRYVPYFYTPKFGRRFYSIFMFLSIFIHSGFWIKRKKIDIMLASWAFPDAVATKWLSDIFKAKFFFKVHGSDINEFAKSPSRSSQISVAAKKAIGIISVSQALKNEMIGMGIEKEKIHVIYNGVNHEKFGQNNNDNKLMPLENYVLYIGNLKRAKGVFELLNGFSIISAKFPSLHLVYAGPGALKKELLSQATLLGIESKVVFLGTVNHDELPSLINNANLLALPSYNEGVPNVVLESMACGTPVLATSVGGIPEVINENICGVIIPPKNHHAIAEGIEKIVTSSWSREDIKAHSQQFTWQKNKSQLLTLLSS